MRILISTHAFWPDIGGLESVSETLAKEFANDGHKVRLITQTEGSDVKSRFPFEIVRRPNALGLFRLTLWSDVVFQNNISMHTLWPALLLGRPWVVTHQTWIAQIDGAVKWRERLKRMLLQFGDCVSISNAIANHLNSKSIVIGNPYRDDIFQRIVPIKDRQRELVFVGRLVSDKGVDILLHAVSLLKDSAYAPRVTIVGAGPEELALRRLASHLRLEGQVQFAGNKREMQLVEVLNEHKILVVPSRWAEPFGVVALEGIACGCVVVGSEDGGLKEAIGPCGFTFPNGDCGALAATLERVLSQPEMMEKVVELAAAHLGRFKAAVVAKQYLRLFTKVAA